MAILCELPDGSRGRTLRVTTPFDREAYATLSGRMGEQTGATARGREDVPATIADIPDSAELAHLIVPEALDALNVGVLATDRFRRVVFANRTAQQILMTRDGLQITIEGVLETIRRDGRSTLSDLISIAASPSISADCLLRSTILAVKRTSGRRPLTVAVRSVKAMASVEAGGQLVLVFVLDPGRPVWAAETGLRQLHAITAREAHLANLLMEGNTLEECCERLGIRTSTARMHLASLFAKTGVQRQGELISLLLTSLGMIRAREDIGNGPVRKAGDCRSTKSSSSALAVGLEALDLLEIGVTVANGSGRVLFANQAAKTILAARDGLEVTSQGTLSTLERSARCPWNESKGQPTQDSKANKNCQPETLLAVARNSGKRPLTLMVRNVAAQAGPQEPAFLIFILDPERPMRVDEDWLRQLYGLTPCEARLANLLIEGKTFDSCCNQLEIRPSTARMHLGNLFAKTGVQRQGQLISLLVRSLGMIRSPESVVRATKEETSNEITNRFPRLRYGFT